jgi:hypothetical protein
MKVSFIIIVLLVFVSCESNLDLEIPYTKNQFVLYSELTPNKPVSIKIDRTYPATGNVIFDNSFLKNTIVEFYENNIKVEILKQNGTTNFFQTSTGLRPVEGKEYYFIVKADGFEEAKSRSVKIPSKIIIDAVKLSEENVISSLNPKIPAKRLQLEFNRNDKEYFITEISSYFQSYPISINVIPSKVPAEFGNPCVYQFASYLQVYNSKCYNQSRNVLDYTIELEGGVGEPIYGNRKITNLQVKMSNVEDFYLEFYKNYTVSEGIFRALEPIRPTVTNIVNGYGAVLAKNEASISINVN